MRNIKHHRLAVTEWQMGGLFAIVPRSGSCRSHRTASQQCCCPGRSSRTNFQVLVLESQVLGHQVPVLVLVLEAWLLVLVLVLESQVLDLVYCDSTRELLQLLVLNGEISFMASHVLYRFVPRNSAAIIKLIYESYPYGRTMSQAGMHHRDMSLQACTED